MSIDDRRLVVVFAVVIAAFLGVMGKCAPVPHESPAQRLGWVGAYGRVKPAGLRMCADHGQAQCTAAWLETHAAQHESEP